MESDSRAENGGWELAITIGLCPHQMEPGSPMFEQTFRNIDDVLWKEAGWGVACCSFASCA